MNLKKYAAVCALALCLGGIFSATNASAAQLNAPCEFEADESAVFPIEDREKFKALFSEEGLVVKFGDVEYRLKGWFYGDCLSGQFERNEFEQTIFYADPQFSEKVFAAVFRFSSLDQYESFAEFQKK